MTRHLAVLALRARLYVVNSDIAYYTLLREHAQAGAEHAPEHAEHYAGQAVEAEQGLRIAAERLAVINVDMERLAKCQK